MADTGIQAVGSWHLRGLVRNHGLQCTEYQHGRSAEQDVHQSIAACQRLEYARAAQDVQSSMLDPEGSTGLSAPIRQAGKARLFAFGMRIVSWWAAACVLHALRLRNHMQT